MSTPTKPRKPVSRTHGQYVVDLPDTGCECSPTCAGYPWRECVLLMPPSERRIFRLAQCVAPSGETALLLNLEVQVAFGE